MNKDENVVREIALVTGANSGIGFETAYQLASAGYGKVILACRTIEKGEAARKLLVERGSKDVFEALAVDVSEAESAISGARYLDIITIYSYQVPLSCKQAQNQYRRRNRKSWLLCIV